MWRLTILAALSVLAAMPANAAQRFNCAVDDSNMKLSLDAAFGEKGARPITHFRGALIAKQEAVPAGFRELKLDSSQLVHYWKYEDELRLEVFAEGEGEDDGKSFDLIVKADRKAQTGPFASIYVLTFSADGAKSLQFKGSLACMAK